MPSTKKDLVGANQTAWIAQNQRKLFLGSYIRNAIYSVPSKNVTTEVERPTITFAAMQTKLEAHFKTGSNTTLGKFEFRSSESSDRTMTKVSANRDTRYGKELRLHLHKSTSGKKGVL